MTNDTLDFRDPALNVEGVFIRVDKLHECHPAPTDVAVIGWEAAKANFGRPEQTTWRPFEGRRDLAVGLIS